MKRQYLNPKDLSTPRFYTHTVTTEDARKTVYISGQVSWDASGSVVGKGDMRAQSEQVFKNVTAALKAAGAGWRDFLKEVALPASTLVGVGAFVHPDLLLEVEVIATL